MTPPRRRLVPAWMWSVSPGHHIGGIFNPDGHVANRLMRGLYQRDGDPPPGPGPIDWRATIDHGSTPEPDGRVTPPLLYTRRPPRHVSLADRFFEWLERRLSAKWGAELMP